MYVDTSKTVVRGKTYYRHLLRDSYRENGKVKHHTIANLSRCSQEEIQAIKLALKYKGQLAEMVSVHSVDINQGIRIGAVCFLLSVAEKIKLVEILGSGQQARLALWRIFACLIDRKSCLSVFKLAQKHSAFDLLKLKPFNEDQLDENLSWLAVNEEKIRRCISAMQSVNKSSQFDLHDDGFSIKNHPAIAFPAYLLKTEIEKYWQSTGIPFDEGMNEISSIHTVELTVGDRIYQKLPSPTGLCKELLDAADVKVTFMHQMISDGWGE